MRALLAWLLTQVVELLASLCTFHDLVVKLIVALFPPAGKFLKNRVFEIKGRKGEKDTVYMIRYVLFATKPLRLYAHRFLRSDNIDEFHNHPWNAAFLQLRNTYTEEVLDPGVPEDENANRLAGCGWFRVVTKQRSLLEVTRANRNHIHRVALDKEYHEDFRNAPLTLALCGDRSKDAEGNDDWAFWVAEQSKGPWTFRRSVPWMKHLQDSKPSH